MSDECVVAVEPKVVFNASLQPQLNANFGPADCERSLCIGKLRNKAIQVFGGVVSVVYLVLFISGSKE